MLKQMLHHQARINFFITGMKVLVLTHQFFERNELPSGAGAILKKLEISPPKTVVDVSRKP